MAASDETTKQSNRLIHEKSPYLLQHAYNPVDWYPWGDEAFAKAAAEDKPVFLSIGYSTCHWCHVMERESFENPEIAALMNQWFVNIKVDREEYPDVDHVYMSAVTAMTGQGGWPLTVFLTPERKPFFGGTYFPPDQQWGRPGMRELLPAMAKAWTEKREQIDTSSDELTAALGERLAEATPPAPITGEMMQAAFNQAAASFDASSGGFGGAPKFPRSPELAFLLRYWARTGTGQALEMAETTLDHLDRGGIHDHVGGGFHRYSTDAGWLVPHFEKMLYDQALLARTYLEAYRATRRAEYADVARDIFTYVLRDLTGSAGGFLSAEDADSEGEEGKFYVWTPDEVIQLLGEEEGTLFNRFYGVTPQGNFEHGTSILHIAQPLAEFAKANELDAQQVAQRLASSRATLFAAREKRIRPHLDDKVLTSWNGLMIAALAYGGATLNEPRYIEAAQRAAEFLLAELRREGRLLRRYREGQSLYPGTLEDYAFFSDGLLELYEATYDPRWLSHARELSLQMLELFSDPQGSGFFMRGKDEPALIVRSKEIYDGAIPSGNSMAVYVLLRLGRLTAEPQFDEAARKALDGFAEPLTRQPFGSPLMFWAVDFALGPTREIVIAGDPEAPDTRRMVRLLQERYLPRAVSLLHGRPPGGAAIEALAPFVKTQEPLDGKATAYICENFICQLPITDFDAFAQQLKGGEG